MLDLILLAIYEPISYDFKSLGMFNRIKHKAILFLKN